MKFTIGLILFALAIGSINAQQKIDITQQMNTQVVRKIETYSKKDGRVYFGNKQIEGADPNSFVTLPYMQNESILSHVYAKELSINKVHKFGKII